MNKYLHLTTNEESNIAVIQCDKNGEFFNEQIETALAEHFDLDIQINSIETLSEHPMKQVVKYSYDDGELVMGSAYLNQTWLY